MTGKIHIVQVQKGKWVLKPEKGRKLTFSTREEAHEYLDNLNSIGIIDNEYIVPDHVFVEYGGATKVRIGDVVDGVTWQNKATTTTAQESDNLDALTKELKFTNVSIDKQIESNEKLHSSFMKKFNRRVTELSSMLGSK